MGQGQSQPVSEGAEKTMQNEPGLARDDSEIKELDMIKYELAKTRSELATIGGDLEKTKMELNMARDELERTRSELATKEKIIKTQKELSRSNIRKPIWSNKKDAGRGR